jgi:3-hydroxyisobutyrate dehydrogenase-like beta-hydroxyacid dehydrogenase
MAVDRDDSKDIGLIGVGLVGTALARNLLAGGYAVVGYDIVPERMDHLQRIGGRKVDCPADVARAVGCVLLSLPESTAVRRVMEGPRGVLEADRLPTYVIDTTTGDPAATMELAKRLADRGVAFLDATISGSSGQVGRREAIFMVGGDRAAFDACHGVFQALSDRVFYLGSSGAGAKAKLATNLVLGLNRLALAEGLVFAESLGLDLRSFLELLRAGPAYSAAVDVKGEKMLHADFATEARLKQHHKDVSLILKYARQTGQELPLTGVHEDILEKSIEAGEGELDNAAVINEIRRRRTR